MNVTEGKVAAHVRTWHCLDRCSGELFEVHGSDEETIQAAVEAYIREGIDADTGDVEYDVHASAIDGSEYSLSGMVSPVVEDGDTDEEEDEELTVGWVACDYTTGDRLDDVRHGEIRAFSSEADADYRQADDVGEGYDGIRYVHTDGYLYVEQPDSE